MSKKLYSTRRWKKYIATRQAAADRSAKRRNRRRRAGTHKRGVIPIEKRRFHLLPAPTHFSIVQNPEDAIQFLNNIRFYGEKHNLTLDLANVNILTTDAIAVLVATLAQVRTYVRGNLPIAEAPQKMLVGSGFFDHYRSIQTLPPVSHGRISQEKSMKVEPNLAKDLIHFGTRALGTEQKCTSAYRVLIESMSNTHNHAAKHEFNRELWWATVYADTARKRVCFTFVDTGVGIFRSVRLDGFRRFYRLIGVKDNADILRDMLHGEVKSSTGIPYRGKGFPAIFKMSQLGKVKSLVIVANEVHADVPGERFRILNGSFRGTLLYWEIELK